MSTSTLTKRVEFSASHRYHQKDWDTSRNRQVFGPCVQEHGHNYLLEVTLGGQVDSVTGMIINLYDLKTILTDVLEEFDHKHLNLDTPYFDSIIPTTENLALVLWRKFRDRVETKNISKLTLYEGPDLWAEIKTPPSLAPEEEPAEATVSRRYRVSFVPPTSSPQPQGWHVTLSVTVGGPIELRTGRVTDIGKLDERVLDHIIHPLSGIQAFTTPPWNTTPFTLGNLLSIMWEQIHPLSQGKLTTLTLQDHLHTVLEFSGTD